MNRVILCEGYDDAVFLGYYLYKITEHKCYYNSKITEISKNLHLPKEKEKMRDEKYTNTMMIVF